MNLSPTYLESEENGRKSEKTGLSFKLQASISPSSVPTTGNGRHHDDHGLEIYLAVPIFLPGTHFLSPLSLLSLPSAEGRKGEEEKKKEKRRAPLWPTLSNPTSIRAKPGPLKITLLYSISE